MQLSIYIKKQGHGLSENKFLLLLWTNINKCSTEGIDSSHNWLQFQSVPWPVSPLLHNINWPQLHFFIAIGFAVSILFVRVSHEPVWSWRKVFFSSLYCLVMEVLSKIYSFLPICVFVKIFLSPLHPFLSKALPDSFWSPAFVMLGLLVGQILEA